MGVNARVYEQVVGKEAANVRRDPIQRVRDDGVPTGEACGWSNEARRRRPFDTPASPLLRMLACLQRILTPSPGSSVDRELPAVKPERNDVRIVSCRLINLRRHYPPKPPLKS